LQLPALLWMGLPFTLALSTHKVASVALGLGATARHLKNRQLRLSTAALILAAGVPGVMLGAQGILVLPEQWATLALGLLTLGLGCYSLLQPQLGQVADPRPLSRRSHLIGALGLFLIGVLNGSLTSGTGLFVTLWLVRWYRLEYKLAVAYTLVLVGLVWNGSGAVALALQTEVQWNWLPALLAGSLLGGYLGAHLSQLKGNLLVKRCFEAVTLAVGVSLVLRVLAS
jgi:uncharacterized membrane protein YfcA